MHSVTSQLCNIDEQSPLYTMSDHTYGRTSVFLGVRRVRTSAAVHRAASYVAIAAPHSSVRLPLAASVRPCAASAAAVACRIRLSIACQVRQNARGLNMPDVRQTMGCCDQEVQQQQRQSDSADIFTTACMRGRRHSLDRRCRQHVCPASDNQQRDALTSFAASVAEPRCALAVLALSTSPRTSSIDKC